MSTRKLVGWLLLILALGGLCLYLNRDWFGERPIHISHRVSPWLNAARGRHPGPPSRFNPVVFSFDGYYKLKEVKVVVTDEIATNKYAHPLWHLVSESNSVPVASFAYGERLRGMMPEVKGSVPDPLQPGVKYRLLVKTSDQEAEHDFATTARN
jgi:hypothetical protein